MQGERVREREERSRAFFVGSRLEKESGGCCIFLPHLCRVDRSESAASAHLVSDERRINDHDIKGVHERQWGLLWGIIIIEDIPTILAPFLVILDEREREKARASQGASET
jgi:hypothetical protein